MFGGELIYAHNEIALGFMRNGIDLAGLCANYRAA
jgi:hypothetical protein